MKKRKFLAVLLALVLTLSLLPTAALAEASETLPAGTVASLSNDQDGTNYYCFDSLADAVKKAKSGDTIKMWADFVNADLSNSTNFSLKDGVTLDGQGHEIRGNASVYMSTAAGTSSTVNNVVFKYIHNGSMASQSDCDWYGWENGKQGTKSAIYASNLYGEVNITNCVFDNADWDAIQITPYSSATINITGNTFSHSSTTDYSQLRYIHMEGKSSSSATVNVTGNRFYKTKNPNADTICNIGIWYIKATNMTLTGNYFEYDPTDKKVCTNSEVQYGGIASLFPALAAEDATTATLNPVSYIGDIAYLDLNTAPAAYDFAGTTYATVQNAIDNCPKSYFYLAKDCSEEATIPAGKSFGIYTKTYKMNGTITNNGTMEFTSGSNTDSAGTIINNGTLQLGCNAATGCSVTNNGTLKITYGETYDLNKITGAGTIAISGGTFTRKPDSAMIVDGYIANSNGDGTYTVAKMTADQATEAGKKVATSTGSSAIYYPSVEAGIADGQTTLYLLVDYSDNITIPAGKILTLNVNKKSLTGVVTNNGILKLSAPAQVENNGLLMITGGSTYDVSKISNAAGATVSISGGTFNAKPDDAWMALGYAANVDDGASTFTVKKVTLTDAQAIAAGAVARYSTSTSTSRRYYKTVQEGILNGALHLLANVNENVAKSGTISLYCDAYTFTGSLSCPGNTLYIYSGTATLNNIECGTFYGGYSSNAANITVKNGTAAAINVAKNATVLIEGGTYTGSITVTSGGTGSLTITGGTFSSDPKDYLAPNHASAKNMAGTYDVVEGYAYPVFIKGVVNDANTYVQVNADGTAANVVPFTDENGKLLDPHDDPAVSSQLNYWVYNGYKIWSEKDGVVTLYKDGAGQKAIDAELAAWFKEQGDAGAVLKMDVTALGSWNYPSGGSSSGGSSSSTTTEKNPDGSTTTTTTDKTTGTVTETTKNTDGSTTTVETKKDGTVTETNKAADGTTGTVVTDKNGDVTEVKSTVSTKAATEAAKTGEAVTLPVEVPAAKTTEDAPAVQVSVPKSAGSVKVEVPVEKVTPGTVAIIVNADGTEEIVSTSVVTETGVVLTLDGSATVKVIDNSKDFIDVPETNVFYNEISSLSAREIMVGKTEDTFDLYNDVTLNQVANVAGRITGEVDVKDFNAGIIWGSENGLKTGNEAATRGEVLKALYVAAGSPAVADTSIVARFNDAASIPTDMAAIVAWAAQNGILKGTDAGNADLNVYVTRGQACALASRTMGTLV